VGWLTKVIARRVILEDAPTFADHGEFFPGQDRDECRFRRVMQKQQGV
jgi:hypothetical protein